ncbi:Serine/threonine-protein kinase PknD [Rosistilla oblonga]|uniref:NHL repeat-containing protein n=1 Tax=Rosistilla oblonga TaxID=2527990 RepID=UPI0011888262|nr:NHL repeat-containing protein [Rosistilla oblonga]QDV12344.1 Serine/threonine-protein kinase PknD [Rosistilla oblonga]
MRFACTFAQVAALSVVLLGGLSAEETVDEETPSRPKYPLAIAVDAAESYVVDLDLPGVWKLSAEGQPTLFVRGSKWIRKPLNRPRCVAILPDGDLLIGDTPTREVYRIAAAGGEPKPLTAGGIGIPMSIAVDADENVYVADLETRTIVRFPLAGGKVETFAQVNTRGLSLDPQGQLWAVTQDKDQLVRIDSAGKATPVVSDRPFQFPHNVVVTDSGDAFVTDGYAKAIWRIPAGGKPEQWLTGPPLINPVGLAIHEGNLFVADPHAKNIYKIAIDSKQITPLIKD